MGPISYVDWITWWTNGNYDPKRQKDIAALVAGVRFEACFS